MFYIKASHNGESRYMRSLNIRGDGTTIESQRVIQYQHRQAAEKFCDLMRKEHPDTEYQVEEK